MKSRLFGWAAKVLVPLVAFFMIATSSSSQVQDGTGKQPKRFTGFMVNPPG